jgi:hypothetical protein
MSTTLVSLGLRSLVATVWAYNGGWCKVAGRAPSHRRIVARIPLVPTVAAGPLTGVIGALECGLAAWVLSGARPAAAAAVQSSALVAMNAGGLAWAGEEVADRTALIRRSGAFIALLWMSAAFTLLRR